MLDDAANKSVKQRGRPFKVGASGNPRGRPRGSRNKRTRAVIEAAEAGGELPLDYMLQVMRDANAKLACRDEMARAAAPYLHPRLAATERPSKFQLPELASAADASKAMAAITVAVARGELTPAAAGELARVIIAFVKTTEAADRKSGGAVPEGPPPIIRLIFTDDKEPSSEPTPPTMPEMAKA